MDSDKLLNLATALGSLLAESGAEISRVEESVYRLLRAYGGRDAQVFAIPSCLIVSLTAEYRRPVTRMRRIGAHGTDIELLEACNALCRRLCRRDKSSAVTNTLLQSLSQRSQAAADRAASLLRGLLKSLLHLLKPPQTLIISRFLPAFLSVLSVIFTAVHFPPAFSTLP